MTDEFKTYWIIDGIKINSYDIMRKHVLAGATAIEVTAASQEVAENERKRRAREYAFKDAEIRRAAAQREHERSPEGMQEEAIRTASRNPGGIVSGGADPFWELDGFGPKKTNLLE
jgi:hypothetical protein